MLLHACTLTVRLMHACMYQLHYFLLPACPLTPASWTRWKTDDHPPRSSTSVVHRSSITPPIIYHRSPTSIIHRSSIHRSPIYLRSSIIDHPPIINPPIIHLSSIIDHRSSTDHPPIITRSSGPCSCTALLRKLLQGAS